MPIRALTLLAVLLIAGASASAVNLDSEWVNSLMPKGTPGAQLTLATEGKTDYVVVLPAKPRPAELKAAEELTTWLKEISGAKIPVVREGSAPRRPPGSSASAAPSHWRRPS